MKQFLLNLLFIALMLNTSAQVLQTSRKTIVFHHAEDWCPSCGDWGWALMDSMMRIQTTNPAFKGYNVSVYFNSNQQILNSPLALLIGDNVVPQPVFAIPTITADNEEVDVFNDFDWNADPDSLGDLVDPAVDSIVYYANLKTPSPAPAAVGFYKTIKNSDSLIIKTRVKFQLNTSGEYCIAVYAIQDSIYGWQTDGNSNIFNSYHRMVLKDAVQYGAWGQLITSGSVTANQEFTHNFRMKIPAGWNAAKLQYLAIVYKRNVSNNTYEIQNVTNNWTPEPNNIAELQQDEITVYPVPAHHQLFVNGIKDPGDYTISLATNDGRKLKIETVALKNCIEIIIPSSVTTGNYFLNISRGNSTITKPVLIQ
jgi:hypothetical protein